MLPTGVVLQRVQPRHVLLPIAGELQAVSQCFSVRVVNRRNFFSLLNTFSPVNACVLLNKICLKALNRIPEEVEAVAVGAALR